MKPWVFSGLILFIALISLRSTGHAADRPATAPLPADSPAADGISGWGETFLGASTIT